MLKPLWYLIPSEICFLLALSTATRRGPGVEDSLSISVVAFGFGKAATGTARRCGASSGWVCNTRGERTPAPVGCPSPPVHIPWCWWESPRWLHRRLDTARETSHPGRVCCFCSFSGSCGTKAAPTHVGPSPPPSAVLAASLSTVPWVLWYHVSSNVYPLQHPRASAGIVFGGLGVSRKSQRAPRSFTSSEVKPVGSGREKHFTLTAWEKWFWRFFKRNLESGEKYLLENSKNTL